MKKPILSALALITLGILAGCTSTPKDLEEKTVELKISSADSTEISTKGIKARQIVCHASGDTRQWRELHIPQGKVKFSNWSVQIKITDENDKKLICDYIELSDCNYKIKQSRIRTETSTISFTTPGERGWADIKFKVKAKYEGSIYNFDIKLDG